MSLHTELERLIGTAIVDGEFRANLLESPISAAAQFNLSAEEIQALRSASTTSWDEFAACLHDWIREAPKLRHTPTSRWNPEEYVVKRIAV